MSVTVFDKALMLAMLEGQHEPVTAEDLYFECPHPDDDDDMSEKDVERAVEALESEGLVVRTEHTTYCSACHSDAGVEYRYALKETSP